MFYACLNEQINDDDYAQYSSKRPFIGSLYTPKHIDQCLMIILGGDVTENVSTDFFVIFVSHIIASTNDYVNCKKDTFSYV